MTNIIEKVEKHLFQESNLSVQEIVKATESLAAYKQDYADIFLQEMGYLSKD